MKPVPPTRGNGVLEGFLASRRAETANSLIPEGLRKGAILDIGCGVYPYFLIHTRFARKYGLDRLFRATDHETVQESITFLDQDLEKESILPFEANFFDVVTMLAFIEHLETPVLASVLSEVYRVLKIGGVMVVTTPAGWTDGLLRILARIHIVSTEEIEEHKDYYDPDKLAALFRQAAFPRQTMRFGYFEMRMNVWGVAEKNVE